VSDDLTAFVTARLDEDEAAAKAWLPFGNPDAAQRDHIARHDPARALREVASLRALAGMHHRPSQAQVDHYVYTEAAKFCSFCGPGDSWEAREHPDWFDEWPCHHMRLIAAIWSDHPDYRPEWAPEGEPDGT
jgi:uncharacterized protein DUF6221